MKCNIDSDAVICCSRAVRKDTAWMRDILQLRSGEELLVGPCNCCCLCCCFCCCCFCCCCCCICFMLMPLLLLNRIMRCYRCWSLERDLHCLPMFKRFSCISDEKELGRLTSLNANNYTYPLLLLLNGML